MDKVGLSGKGGALDNRETSRQSLYFDWEKVFSPLRSLAEKIWVGMN